MKNARADGGFTWTAGILARIFFFWTADILVRIFFIIRVEAPYDACPTERLPAFRLRMPPVQI